VSALAVVEPTLAMGLEDLVPVALTGATLVVLARRLERPWLFVAAALVVAGGTAKAGWKIAFAATGVDHPAVAEALFPLLAPGLAIAASSLWMPRRRPITAVTVAGCVEVLAVAVRSTAPLLVATIVGSMAVTVWVGHTCWRSGRPLGTVLAAAQLAASFLLARLAAVPEQTNALQWVEQSGNTAGAAALLAAAHIATTTPRPVLQEALA
jgi:hypothetical protein